MSKRKAFLDWCLKQEGKSYIWGAKGPDTFDCSGLVTAGIYAAGGPDWRAFWSSAVLYTNLQKVETPEAGDLVFYGNAAGRVSHVMVVWGDGRVFGAAGGGRQTTTPSPGARVLFRRGVKYRNGFMGYRKFPLED